MSNSIGPTELIIVLVIVLLIFGPKRLPGLGKQLGTRHARVQGLDHAARTTTTTTTTTTTAGEQTAGRRPRPRSGAPRASTRRSRARSCASARPR